MASVQETYVPGKAPAVEGQDAKELANFVQREFKQIAQAQRDTPIVHLQRLGREPERPRDGMVVYADGVGWDPGSGEGVYARVAGVWIPSGGTPGSLLILDARVLGFGAGGASDNVTALNDCIAYAEANGVHEIWLPEGTFELDDTITVDVPGIVFRGRLNESYHDAAGNNFGTILQWTGAAGGVMWHFTPVLGVSGPALSGSGLHDVYLDGMGVSGPLLKCTSLKYCKFSGILMTAADTEAAFITTCCALGDLGEDGGLQNCTFRGFIIRQIGYSDAIWFTGNNDYNTSYNIFENFVCTHGPSNGIVAINCDNNDLMNMRCYSGGEGGTGLILYASTETDPVIGAAMSARNNTFRRLYAEEGVFSMGTDTGGVTYPAQDNRIYEYDISNIAPLPLIGTGSRLIWTPDSYMMSGYPLAATSGYVRHETGMIEQWGYVALSAGASSTFSLPLAFPNNYLNVQATIQGFSGSPTHSAPPMAQFVSVSQLDVTNKSSSAATIFWRAWGW